MKTAAAMKGYNDDEDWVAAKKALVAACRLPGGKNRIEALKHAGRLRSYAIKKRLAAEKSLGKVKVETGVKSGE